MMILDSGFLFWPPCIRFTPFTALAICTSVFFVVSAKRLLSLPDKLIALITYLRTRLFLVFFARK